MIGVDTNILVRYLLEDDPVWSRAATRLIDETLTPDEPGFVSPVTLAELAWVLRRQDGYDRGKLGEVIRGLLAFDNMVVGERAAVERALVRFEAGGAGFADYLIAEMNAAAGASPTLTIDGRAGRTEPFEPLRR